MGKYSSLAKQIVENVGGPDNINGLSHCITRLRFRLKDESKANDDVLKNMDGVVTIMKSGGQYQVVIGNHVPLVYEEVVAAAGIADAGTQGDAPQGLFNKFLDIISGCFQPFLGVLAASGMLKGVLALLVSFKMLDRTSDTYLLFYQIGDAIFYFMPIVIGYTSAKKFKLHPIVGMAIGMAMCLPTLQLSGFEASFAAKELIPETIFAGTLFESKVYMKIFGVIPVILNNYTSSVVPVIFVTAFAAQVQKIAKRVIPEMIQNFFVPFVVLSIAVPVGFVVIGPVISVLTNVLQNGFSNLMAFSPILYGLILGTFWQVLVIFGLHWSVVPLMYIQIAQFGTSQVLVPAFTASFAQTAVVLAMFFKLKDQKLKSLAIPAFISGIMGVTEPAIYGLTLPKKKPFIFSLVGAGIGGMIMMAFDLVTYQSGGLGIFGVFNYIKLDGDASGAIKALIAVAAAVSTAFLLTMFFWKDDYVDEEETTERKGILDREDVLSPITGTIIPLANVKDEAFAMGTMGNGLAIQPTEGKVVAPFDGTVTALFPTNHAIGITSDNGMELLIHVGLDTVQLDGQYFEALVKQGDKVTQGQTLLKFDIDAITEAGYNLETPIIITNKDDYLDILPIDDASAKQGDIIIRTVIR
ncbi:PTS transporter subunit EIIC [Erysipelothrix sp. HDW6A]|uniref:beta-glucoside-specific PTS transporter subunit IIABC n=1 Tax=Erysipelothrix sp. HDW6A TaxID=2714928 RepID=UPI001408F574|nr:beta-glucoside-specific PTS transporter subunit IIABC [Erysipelothrix sp. HDW6A]QIK58054.1 PTS transporter subunit EIIC [Erysipelothrix sp. HDW6A]